MKHLIRILCLLLCLVLAAGALVACNDDTDDTPPADDGNTQPPAGDGNGDGNGDTTPPAIETYTVRGYSIVGDGNALLTTEYEKSTNKVLKETYTMYSSGAPSGAVMQVTYGTDGTVTSLSLDLLGYEVYTYTIGTDGKTQDGKSFVEYHTNGLVKKAHMDLEEGLSIIVEYDEMGRRVSERMGMSGESAMAQTYTYEGESREPKTGAMIFDMGVYGSMTYALTYTYANGMLTNVSADMSGAIQNMNYSYDAAGLVTKIEMSNVEGNVSTLSSVFAYTYNTDGKCTKATGKGYAFDGTTVESENTHEYTYDANGNTTKDDYTFIDYTQTPSYIDHYVTTFEYDANNNCIKEVETSYENGTTVVSGITERIYTYNAAGKVTKEIDNWKNAEGEIQSTYEYTFEYDANGNLIKETESSTHGDTYTWEYNASGDLIKESKLSYQWVGDDMVKTPTSFEEFEYDANGYITKETRKAYDIEGVQESHYVRTYTLNDKGDWSRAEHVNYNADGSVKDSSYAEFTYQYDDNGNCTRGEGTQKDSSTNAVLGTVVATDNGSVKIITTYDADGEESSSSECDSTWGEPGTIFVASSSSQGMN